MVIRDVIQTDIPSLAILAQETYKDTFGHTMTKEELIESLKFRSEDHFYKALKTDIILVAIEEDKLVGFIQLGVVTYDSVKATDRDIKLSKIYIDKPYQGKGIGKLLMEAMFKHPRMSNVSNIYLDVFYENKTAIGLYKKYGFQIIGQTPFILNGKIVGYDLLMKYSKVSSTKVT